jgi:hypothetical protein
VVSYIGGGNREGLATALQVGAWKHHVVNILSQVTTLNGDIIGMIIDYHERPVDITGLVSLVTSILSIYHL